MPIAGRRAAIPVILTAGRDVLAQARSCGVLSQLEASGVRALPDLCWCSISEPVFPPQARAVLTNSGKYAHYGPGLSGRSVRFGRLADCINAALSGRARAFLRPVERMRSFAAVASNVFDAFEAEVAWLLERLRAAGIREAIAVDLTRSEFGIPVVRVVAPGLEGSDHHDGYSPGARALRGRNA